MNTGIEKRRYPRALVWWPVILMSPDGSIMGTIRNISISDALIFCLEQIKNENEFLIMFLSPKGHEIQITCKKVWSGIMPTGNSDYIAIGIIFTKISSSTQDFIDSLVAEHSLA